MVNKYIYFFVIYLLINILLFIGNYVAPEP